MSDAEESEDSNVGIPQEVLENYKLVTSNLLPEKSREKYVKAYEQFVNWKKTNHITSSVEKVLLVYFNELAEKKNWKSSTLWSHWSMLRTMLTTHENIEIKAYAKLKCFMKKKSIGYQPKKAGIFTSEHVQRYCDEAHDDEFLATKVALILGFLGGLRRDELVNIKTHHIREEGSSLFIDVPNTKNHQPKSFVIVGQFVNIVKKYQALRPSNCSSDRFFLNLQKGRCTNQPIGINKFGEMPKKIARYLGLPNPEKYTGHTFRRTSATMLMNGGADITTLKRHGGWKSNSVAEGYIGDSISNRKKICEQISSSIQLKVSESSKENADEVAPLLKRKNIQQLEPGTSSSKDCDFIARKTTPEALDELSIPKIYNFHNCNVTFVDKKND